MKIFVLGGDGFCGWPLSLALSAAGHDVLIIDNFCRRQIDIELQSASLTPICSLEERLRAWRSVTGRAIENAVIDIANDYGSLRDIVRAERPDAIVHLAEQRSVPYSMSSLAR
ncbi:MAG: NAD-dependent epimerase/dehydratase family protein, partial [Hyphomicrobium sp.]